MSTTISALTAANSIDATQDYLPIVTNNINTTQKINRNTFLNIASQPLGLTDTQSPTNKTFDNTNTITAKDGNFTLQSSGGVTKQAQFVLSSITAGQTRTLTIPDANITLVGTATTQTLTNKTLTSPTISSPTITNATLTTDAVTGFTTSNSGTLFGTLTATTGNGQFGGTLGVTGATTLSSTLAVTSTSTLTGQVSIQTGTAPPAAGATSSGIKVSSTANFGIFWGSGAPTFSAAQGSLYLRTDGSSTSTRAYINQNGSTTWTNITTGA